MRFARLHLERFGRFSGAALDFRAGARLHLVFGANEAGKSTALAATRALLFGMHDIASYAFDAKVADLRLGCEIEARDGRRLSFRRRGAPRNGVFDDAGARLADDALAPWIGGVNADIFTRAFGLDAEGLRRGARELFASRGDADASLMAAASGLTGLTRLRATLEEEADGLFAPRASKERRVYQILERREIARKRVAELELGETRWKALLASIRESAEEFEQASKRRREIATRLARLTRLSTLAPLARRIDDQARALAAHDDLPNVRAGFGADLAAALDRVAALEEAVERASEAREKIAREPGATTDEEELIAAAADIASAYSRLVSYRDAARDLPHVETEVGVFAAELAHHAAALGFAGADEIESSRPGAAALARVAELARKGEALETRAEQTARARAKERDALAALEAASATRGALVDPAPLREKFAVFGDVPERAERARREALALDSDERALAAEAARLSPPADLAALACVPLPTPQTIEQFQKRFDAAAQSLRDSRRAGEEAATKIAEIDARLAAQGEVPTRERLARARALRDDLYARVRAAAFAEPAAPSGAALASAVARFEAAVAEADRLADDGARDAERVAAWNEARRARDEFERIVARHASNATNAQAAATRVEAEWKAAWAAARLEPRAPSEMTPWLARVDALSRQSEKLAARRVDLSALEADLAACLAPLAALARESGLADLEGLDVARWARRVFERLRAVEEPWNAARGDARAMTDARTRVEKIDAERVSLDAERTAWREQWSDAMGALGARRQAGIEEARALVAIWEKAPTALRQHADRQARVEKMRRALDEFEVDAARLVAAVAPDLRSLPHGTAIETLHERLAVAREAQVRRRERAKQLDAMTEALARATSTRDGARESLAELMESLPPSSDPRLTAKRLRTRDDLREQMTALRAQFAEQSSHEDEATLRAELAEFDADLNVAERTELEAELERAADAANKAYALKEKREQERDALGAGGGHEIAVQQMRNAEAELSDAAREWAVLKIGSLMLARALERHRESRRDPLLRRAGEFFGTLTGCQFNAIEEVFDDEEKPRLAGRRASGALVMIDGENERDRSPMSAGTLDQLYLALRLAYVEDYCARAEPVPFIGDDLVASFDDARTGQAIAALADLSARTQPILFTHHRHVVDIAREKLGAALDVIEL